MNFTRASLLSVFVFHILAAGFCIGQSTNPMKPIFNGKDLDGWYGLETIDPSKLAKKSAEEVETLKQKFKVTTEKHWRVENGEIVNDGAGPFLTTEKDYSNFELSLEYKTVANADSGVYLKATPQVQIWDFTEAGGKWKHGADKGSGGLWNNSKGKPGKDPLVLADKPFGEWNSLRIIQIGSRTTVYLNEKLVVDHAVMENYWNRKLPLVKSGPIQLQTHGGEIRWRNVMARELTYEEANKILASKDSDGFKSIFNGKDLVGWDGPVENYMVDEGSIVCKKGKSGTIFTSKEYSDFKARLEFKLPPAGNNGLAIRYPGKGDAAYAGMCELQILNSDYPGKLDDRQYHGSAYGMVAAVRGFLRPTGEWNFQEVTVKGSKLVVELNGSVILNCDLEDVGEFLAGEDKHTGKDRTRGHFGFCGHGAPVQIRNVAVRELAQTAG